MVRGERLAVFIAAFVLASAMLSTLGFYEHISVGVNDGLGPEGFVENEISGLTGGPQPTTAGDGVLAMVGYGLKFLDAMFAWSLASGMILQNLGFPAAVAMPVQIMVLMSVVWTSAKFVRGVL